MDICIFICLPAGISGGLRADASMQKMGAGCCICSGAPFPVLVVLNDRIIGIIEEKAAEKE